MPKQPSVAEIFEYSPNKLHLVGFPEAEVLDSLKRFLGSEVLLRQHSRKPRYKSRIVDPSFALRHIKARQDFFQRLDNNHRIKKNFFDKGLPKSNNLGLYSTYVEFLGLCNEFYDVIKTARTELRDFRHLPETRRIIRKANQFDSELETVLKTLESIESMTRFAIDTQEGVIANISDVPEQERILVSSEDSRQDREWQENIFRTIRVKMKKQAIAIAQEAGVNFRRRILDYVREEFRFKQGRENLRRDFEQLALPARLGAFYESFLNRCEKYEADLIRNYSYWGGLDTHEAEAAIEQAAQKEFAQGFSPMSFTVYPSFGKGYDIRGMFPPKLMTRNRFEDIFVPLSFQSKPSERKFLLAGLHSGGKSFLLENLVLASVLAQAGFSMPADSVQLPIYDNIYYYKNAEDHGGRLDSELTEIEGIVRKAKARDLVIIDEFLDSTSAEIANSLGPAILDRLVELKSTVFVTSHRSTDYNHLAETGWTLMSPDYAVRGDKVIPTKTLVRGPPEADINRRYIVDKYGKAFGVGKRK